MLEAAAGFVTWVGASLVVLADGRRGLALGLALAVTGLAGAVWETAGAPAAAAVFAGGLIAAAGRFRVGAPGWQIMAAGSTPRIVLCVAAGLLSLWLGLVITTGPAAVLRFVAIVCLSLAPARILWSDDRPVGLTAAGVLALAVGAASAIGSPAPGPWAYLAAGLIAAAVAWLPSRWQRAG